MIGIVGWLSQQNELIFSEDNATKECNQLESVNQNEQEIACYIDMEDAILNRRVLAVVDASIDERFVAYFWVITTLEEKEIFFIRMISSQ